MTEVGDFALPTCDGRVLPSFCSGLAMVSRYPFIEVRVGTWSLLFSKQHSEFRNSFWNTPITGTYWSQTVNTGPERERVCNILTRIGTLHLEILILNFMSGRARIAIDESFVVDLFVTHTCAVGNGYSNAYYRTNQVKVRSRSTSAETFSPLTSGASGLAGPGLCGLHCPGRGLQHRPTWQRDILLRPEEPHGQCNAMMSS